MNDTRRPRRNRDAPEIHRGIRWYSADPVLARRTPAVQEAVAVSPALVHELSRQLQLEVEIDTSGRLRGDVEISFTPGPGNSIQPNRVRVAPDAPVTELIAGGGVIERCARYNKAIHELRDLQERSAALVQRGHTPLKPGSEIWSMQRSLSTLDADVAGRQAARMASNVVNVGVLDEEIGFWESYQSYLATVVARAERCEQAALWNVETQEMDPLDG